MDWIGTAVAVAAALSGIILGWLARAREAKRGVQADATQDANMRFDLEYIKRGVDDLRADLRTQKAEYHALEVRVARVEESAKSAHRRIDRTEAGAS